MRKVLWISSAVPFDKVRHAGGQTHNYYLKQLARNMENDIQLITFSDDEDIEKSKADLDSYKIKNEIIPVKKVSKFGQICKYINVFSKYFHSTRRSRIDLRKRIIAYSEREYPDVVILEWTRTGFWIDLIKRVFPDSKYILVQHDVAYQGLKRRFEFEKNPLKKFARKQRYIYGKKHEQKLYGKFDRIITYNEKDKKLIDDFLKKDNVLSIPPYFHNMNHLRWSGNSKDILFFGAMEREENYLSALWFINNVMPILDSTFKLNVIGNNPPSILKDMENDQIKVYGYIEDIDFYFQNSLCLVAPLLIGSGIKVKVLESLSSGLPVLTNEIGIEGIPAANGVNYFLCKTKEEYKMKIEELDKNKTLAMQISNNAQKFMNDVYNLEKGAREYEALIDELTKEKNDGNQ